jgi:hypothetical protein
MKTFVNFDLGALNVATFPVDRSVVAEIEPLLDQASDEGQFTTVRSKWNSDLQWLSAASPDGFQRFQSAFDRLRVGASVAEHLDIDRAPRLYAGFLVIRRRCTAPDFHVDWIDTGNEAFTFMTPITGSREDFGLLYRKVNGAFGDYSYRAGEGIVFGDAFSHSTKPGESEQPVALLCFTFGTDKMEHWPKILRTAGYQSHLIQRPDGQFAVRDGDSWRTISQPVP